MRAALLTCLAGLLLAGFALGAMHRVRTEGSWLPAWLLPPLPEQPAPTPPAAPLPTATPAAAPTPPLQAAAPEPEEPAVISAGEISVLEPDAPAPLVRYVDAEGTVRMVRGIGNVPAAYRAGATLLERAPVNLVNVPAPNAVAFRDWQPDPNPNRVEIVLFYARWCSACERARRWLAIQNIRHDELDIDANSVARKELLDVLGRIAVPLLRVNGRYVSGFKPDVYQRVLQSS